MATWRPRVLVTRSPHQASDLADRLRALGLEPVLIPTLKLTNPTSFAALDAALTHLDRFHWLIFTSANAVEAFHRRYTQLALGPWPSGPRSFRIAAIGSSTARALGAIGLVADLIPPQAVAESLTRALLDHVHPSDDEGGGSSTRFLLIRAEEAREHLPETLHAAGADVTIAPAYRTLVPEDSVSAIRRLFAPQKRVPPISQTQGIGSPPPPLNAITFTSSSSVLNLLALCEAAGVTLPAEAVRVSIGPVTSQTLRERGYPPHAESPTASVAALAETVVKVINRMQVRPL